MRKAELTRIDERIRQLLRTASELEEKYSTRGLRLLRDPGAAGPLMEGREEARRDIEVLMALYAELARLLELRASSSGAARRPSERPSP